MKYIVLFILTLITGLTFSQQWRDSLLHARELYSNKKYDEALNYYRSTVDHAPEDIDLSDEIAQSAYKNRDFEKAEEIYRKGTVSKASKFEKADAYYNLGNTLMKKKKYQEAAEAYKNSLRLDSKNDQTRYNLSEAIRQLKNQEENQEKKNQDGKSDNKDSKDNQSNQKESKNSKSDSPKEGSDSKIPNKTADKLLDQLMKQEAETKRKMTGQKGDKSNSKSGKDW